MLKGKSRSLACELASNLSLFILKPVTGYQMIHREH